MHVAPAFRMVLVDRACHARFFSELSFSIVEHHTVGNKVDLDIGRSEFTSGLEKSNNRRRWQIQETTIKYGVLLNLLE